VGSLGEVSSPFSLPGAPASYEVSLRPLAGGYSGETFVAGAGDDRVVVRIYARDSGRAAVDASLLWLVRGLVPVPEVLELRRPTEDMPALLVTEYVEGLRLDLALVEEPAWLDLETVGRSVGRVLAALAGIPFLRFASFVDADLTASDAPLPDDLSTYAEQLRSSGRLSTWSEADWQGLLGLVNTAEDLLADETKARPARAVLTHSDLNPKNILVDPASSEVSAVLDWEFAHAGSRYADLGNFCRFERDPRLIDPLLDTLADVQPGGAAHQLRLGRAADLWSLLELANRPHAGPVPNLAAQLLLSQSRSADLDAWPWSTPRVSPPAG
jgi:aminoglycoside phosphotransferase (APT) family kinase protein